MPDPTGAGDPSDIYSSIVQGMPTDADRQRALAQQLRSQNLLGNLGLASGDRVLAPEGKSLIEQTGKGLDLYNTQQNEENKLGLSYDEMAQREQIAQMQDARQRDLNKALIGSREGIAQGNWKNRLDVAALRNSGKGGGPIDPDDERLLAMARTNAVPNIPNNPAYAAAWAHGINATYGQRGDDGRISNLQDITDALLANKHEYFGEQRRLAVSNTIEGRTGTSIDEMQRWAPILEDDMSKLRNTQFKGVNWLMNIGRDQLNDPNLIDLQQDIVTFRNALASAQQRAGSTTGPERMEGWGQLVASRDYTGFMSALNKMQQEAQVMDAAARAQSKARAPSHQLTPIPPSGGQLSGGAGVLPQGATVDENGEVKLGPADTSPAGVNDGIPAATPGPRAMHQNGGPVVTTPTPAAPATAAPAPAPMPTRKPGTLNKALQYMPQSMLPMTLKRYYGNLG